METYYIETRRSCLQKLIETLVQVEGYFDDAFNLGDRYYFKINIPMGTELELKTRGFKLIDEQIPQSFPHRRERSI